MCTVIAALRYFKEFPLIIAANRDEFLNRKTDPPSIINKHPLILAPRDRLKFGTFMGVNEWGLTAVITNLSGVVPKDNSKKSRGLIVLRILGSPNIQRVIQDLKHIDFSEYNFFQLFVADIRQAITIVYNGSLNITEHTEGIVTLSNWDAIPEVSDYKNSLIRSKIDSIKIDSDCERIIQGLKEILIEHSGKDMRYQICVHTDNYGTVSSSIIAPFQKEPLFLYSIGPSCKNRFRSYNGDLRGILKV
ncbi:MAG: NRDE family protein [Myxococcota bacterium]